MSDTSGFIEIPLTQGLVALVDASDAAAALAYTWCAHRKGETYYATRNVRRPGMPSATLRLHTFLTGWPYVDHRNGDGLDNRRANLRPASHAENARNTRRKSDNTSGFKGVSWHRRGQKWWSQIVVDGHHSSLGLHATPEEAAHAYDEAAREAFGEFACVNFPRPGERAA